MPRQAPYWALTKASYAINWSLTKSQLSASLLDTGKNDGELTRLDGSYRVHACRFVWKILDCTYQSFSFTSHSLASSADSYQYQLQSMWQKCWNTNQNLMHHMRFRERGPLKSWRPETMAEAIFSVLKEGLSLSQAARKYDIPYPTFVLYANRVHNMLGPSIDGGPDLRPKGRGRPQRILLGIWPDEHIKGVIKTVVFRDTKDIKDDGMGGHMPPYGRHSVCSAALQIKKQNLQLVFTVIDNILT